MTTIQANQGRKQFLAIFVAMMIACSATAAPRATQAQQTELCFDQPGVTACVAPEFRSFWEQNGGLMVFGYPLQAAKEEQTPEGNFLVQYFERQRLELHPENSAPYTVLLGRVNAEVLNREGRNWRDFPQHERPAGQCFVFAETQQSVCGDFYAYWRSHGLDLGDPGVSFRESLGLWGVPLSARMEEQNIDGDTVLTQHFERARMELHTGEGRRQVLLTRLGAALVPLHMKLLALNDLHGQITASRRVGGRPAGGAAYLATYLKQRAAQVEYSLLVHAGDMVGASEPTSALIQDQPAVEFMNRIGMDVGTVGNHEFDEGLAEFYRLTRGGCHPTAGCWKGANFPYVVSNVINTETGKPILPAYEIINVNGARIGFIGAIHETTPQVVVPSAITNLKFLDEVESINRAVKELQQQNVHAIVVLIHEGANQDQEGTRLTGPLARVVEQIDDDVDIVVGSHFHAYTSIMWDGKLVTQAFSYSTAFADIDIVIDRAKRDIVSKQAEIVTTFHEGSYPDPEIAAMVQQYADQVAPLVNRVVGTAATPITREQTPAGESALGNLIADAQRWKMGTQFAFMNPGGIRSDIEAGEVTWGELYSVQPFANDLVQMTLTGEQIYRLLNQQWQTGSDGNVTTRFLQISGLSYTWSDARPVGDKVVEVRGPDGQPLDRGASYTVTVNNFLAGGGDAFTVLREGTNRVVGPVDLDALVDYIGTLPQPFTAQTEGRIVKQ